jgi:hypothetical protein
MEFSLVGSFCGRPVAKLGIGAMHLHLSCAATPAQASTRDTPCHRAALLTSCTVPVGRGCSPGRAVARGQLHVRRLPAQLYGGHHEEPRPVRHVSTPLALAWEWRAAPSAPRLTPCLATTAVPPWVAHPTSLPGPSLPVRTERLFNLRACAVQVRPLLDVHHAHLHHGRHGELRELHPVAPEGQHLAAAPAAAAGRPLARTRAHSRIARHRARQVRGRS